MGLVPWNLYLDDERDPRREDPGTSYLLARSTESALKLVEDFGPPQFMSLDHDLGGADTGMRFARLLVDRWESCWALPQFRVHSRNTVGAANLEAFLQSWLRHMRELGA
jgi:hypothetical protein